MPSILCIIQARRQSNRLPDKILLPLGKNNVLEHVIRRCQHINAVSQVVVAAPEGRFEDVIEDVAAGSGALCFRGSMDNVLDRFWGAWKMAPADYVMRVTADCPLLDPRLCDDLVSNVLEQRADYGALSDWPHGIDCEIFTSGLLEHTQKNAENPADLEHVTLWMKRQKDIKTVTHSPGGKGLHAGNRWVVDYPEDYAFLQALIELAPDNILPWSHEEVLALVNDNPTLRRINAHCEDEWAKKNRQIYASAGHVWTKPT